MQEPPNKKASILKALVSKCEYPLFIGVIALLCGMKIYQNGWAMGLWIGDVLSIVWPLAILAGLLFLLTAHACRELKNDEEAYVFMRRAALSFLISAIVLWLIYRKFI